MDKSIEDQLSSSLGTDQEEEVQEEVAEEPQSEEQPESQSFKLGDREYSQEELQSLVGLGEKAQKIEQNHGSLDNFVSEWGKKSAKIGELNKKIEELTTEEKQEVVQEANSDLMEKAKQELKKIGVPMTEEVRNMIKDEFQNMFSSQYQEVKAGEKLLEKCTNLESTIDGSDGRPKFETEKVLEFMSENPGFQNPEQAYKAMHLDQISEWQANKVLSSKKQGLTTQTGGATAKSPKEVRVTDENLSSLMSEALNG